MKNRMHYIKKIVKNKTVLNMGCASDLPLNEIQHDLWLQKQIEKLVWKARLESNLES